MYYVYDYKTLKVRCLDNRFLQQISRVRTPEGWLSWWSRVCPTASKGSKFFLRGLRNNITIAIDGLDLSRDYITLCHNKQNKNILYGSEEVLQWPFLHDNTKRGAGKWGVHKLMSIEHFSNPVKLKISFRTVFRSKAWRFELAQRSNLNHLTYSKLFSSTSLACQYHDTEHSMYTC